ncbi:transcriptional regulator with XRE-family HTH domain [Scopulibacillus daqui]|uniref:Transcriptional regulator with XRE-family HTH domain n=1 Tax=Scopulibacillus daqui TaxID=1469162 RepID=A0ABS2PZK6_9BACL|nr:helix-turn-helix transcriptional regulator [Scopulibacillus daqui]MBM7645000.1 transcriptional regulator with XRE-family HTH domain [Scopulibacillus daqui]
MELGDKLKKLRKENSYSQQQLAEKLNVTAQAISKWENNKSVPDIINLVQISELYHISLDYLIKPDKQLQSELSIRNIRLRIFNYFAAVFTLIFILAASLLIKAKFFMYQHSLGGWLMIGSGFLFIILAFLSIYCYIVKKRHFIFLWSAILMLGFMVFLGLFYDYIVEVLYPL